ncbi:nitrous oxide reductase accessory protein NosL [bacterium]|nr:nitrous oxide reductase accessory protein NosL [bacterium]
MDQTNRTARLNPSQIRLLGFILLWLVFGGCSSGPASGPRIIESHKECPLCGMYPAKYPLFNCQIIFEDGSYEAFDSAAGLLVYLYFPDKTGFPVKKTRQVFFKDYLYEKWIDANTTWFVMGSEILGPMGIEFLPVSDRRLALEVQKQEKGAAIVSFLEIDRAFMVKAAENGWLHFLARKLVLE